MRVLLVSPLGHQDEWLSTFVEPLADLGHTVTDLAHAADVAFLSLRWGRLEYKSDLIGAIQNRVPFVTFDSLDYVFTGRSEWFDWGLSPNFCKLDMHNTYWNMPWKLALQAVEATGLLRVYFMRQMQQGQQYPVWVKPIDPIMYKNTCFQLDENVGDRPFDLCFVGMSSQCRATLLCHLIESRMFKIDWQWPFQRMDWASWVNRHRQAKMFLEMNGGGFGSDRPYQLSHVAPMLRQRNSRLSVCDWTDGINCLDIANDGGVPQPDDLNRLRRFLDDPKALQAMYETGAAFARERLSPLARTQYVIGVLNDMGIN